MTTTIDKILHSFFNNHTHAWHIQLTKQWRTIVGNLHTRMRLEKIHGDTIVVGVYDQHWMHELFMLSSMITTTINRELGSSHVKHIRFQLAHKKSLPMQEHPKIHKQKRLSVKPLSNKHLRALNLIADEQLRGTLSRILQHCTT